MPRSQRVYRMKAMIGWLGAALMVASIPGAIAYAASPDRQAAAAARYQEGQQQYAARQLTAAVQSWQQALTLYQQQRDRQGEGQTLASLGAAYITLERYRDAVIALQAFLPIADAAQNQRGAAEAYSNLGIAYAALGHYAEALAAQRQAGKLMRTLNDRQGLDRVLINLGNVFEAVGDYDNATIAYQQSLKLARQLGDQVATGVALDNIGTVAANVGHYDDAIAAHTQSLAIAQTTQNAVGQANALINLGAVYHARGDRAKALTCYQQSLTIAQQIGDRRRIASALGSLGLVYEDLKDFPKAIQQLEQSWAIVQTLNDPQFSGMALNNLGHALFGANRLQEAAAKLRQAISLLDALRPELSDTYKVSIFDTQLHTYSLLQQILVADHQPEAALAVAEQGRARAFVELLARRVTGRDQPQPLASGAPTPAIDVATIQQVARNHHATLVEYAIVPDDDFKFRGKQRAREAELLIWVVQPTGQVALRRVDLKPLWHQGATLADVVQLARCLAPGEDCGALAQALREADRATTTPTNRRRQPGLRKLHELLIEPIADLLPVDPTARVIFMPQESLFLVPFAALQDASGRYLIETHTILTAPAIQVLALTWEQRLKQRSQRQARDVLIVGNPTMPSVSLEPGEPPEQLASLPDAEHEAIAVAQLLGTQALTGKQATKVSILQKLPAARWVHLATHGLLEYGNRSTSLQGLGIPGAIALAPSPHDNGLLTASEVLALRLNADLVTLSACDTGRGRITGDGVVGLSRAFIGAGVPSLLVSLWAIPDAPTAQLMTHFYKTLQQQPDKAQALRQAMLATMQDNPYPLDWAAFTLIGEAD